VPEKLLAAEDIKKTERRFAAAEKVLTEKKPAKLVPPLSLPNSSRTSQLVLALN